MLYTLSQIDDIIRFAKYTLIKLAEESETRRYMTGVDLYETEIALIYDILVPVQWGREDGSFWPTSPFQQVTAYLLHKCSRFGYVYQTGSLFYISQQPSNQTVSSGDSTYFSVAVVGTGPITYQWYGPNGIIPGETLDAIDLVNVDAGDAGGYYVVITNGDGQTLTSQTATLTVSTPSSNFTWFAGWFDTDPYATLQVSDPLTYQYTGTAAAGANIVVPAFPVSSAYKWFVVKYPVTELEFDAWNNTAFNYGTIPDQAWRSIFVTGSHRYIVSRTTLAFDPNSSTTFSR